MTLVAVSARRSFFQNCISSHLCNLQERNVRLCDVSECAVRRNSYCGLGKKDCHDEPSQSQQPAAPARPERGSSQASHRIAAQSFAKNDYKDGRTAFRNAERFAIVGLSHERYPLKSQPSQ
jgi:hypothetical protein